MLLASSPGRASDEDEVWRTPSAILSPKGKPAAEERVRNSPPERDLQCPVGWLIFLGEERAGESRGGGEGKR